MKEYINDPTLLGNPMNFSYTFNTDGCQTERKSKETVWPIYCLIHEVAPALRRKTMILVGLWDAKYEPVMNVFLKRFVTQANRLSS